MAGERPRAYSHLRRKLQTAGLRPTRQRLALANLLLDGRQRHVTAEQVHAEAAANRVRVSMATVYNTLHQFTQAGLLREVVVEPGRHYFDTNTEDHHHFYVQGEGRLVDIPRDSVHIDQLPDAPEGMAIDRVDVVVRVRPEASESAQDEP